MAAPGPDTARRPVAYWKVAGTGFYQQFLDNSEWPQFMRAGRETMLDSLRRHGASALTVK